MNSVITVSRTIIASCGITITETVSAMLPDDLALDATTEAWRRQVLANYLFLSLPQLQPKSPPSCPTKPLHSNN